MTTTTGDVFIPEVWSKMVLMATEPELVLANLVTRLDSDVAGKGKSIHVPNVSSLAANDKVAGSEVQLQAPTETEVEVTIDQHKESSFLVEDILALQADYSLSKMYSEKAGKAIAKAIDSSIAALASGFSTTYGTYNTAITTDVILDSIEALDEADVPMSDRHFVYRPDVKRDLLDLSTYTSKDFVSGAPVSSGLIGDLYGVKTYMSTNIVKTGNNTDNMLFHKEAIALAMQQSPRVQSEYSAKDLGTVVVVDTVYGVKELRDDFGVLIKT